jgi:hypothetical protein
MPSKAVPAPRCIYFPRCLSDKVEAGQLDTGSVQYDDPCLRVLRRLIGNF